MLTGSLEEGGYEGGGGGGGGGGIDCCVLHGLRGGLGRKGWGCGSAVCWVEKGPSLSDSLHAAGYIVVP